MRIEGPPYYGIYPGEVVEHLVNDDGTSLGRVMLLVPAIGDRNKIGPALPIGTTGGGGFRDASGTTKPRGLYAVPAVGCAVGVLFLGGDPSKPFYISGWWGAPGGQTEVPDATSVGAPRGSPSVVVWETDKWRILLADGTFNKLRIESKEDPDIFFLFDATTDTIKLRSAGKVRFEAKGSPDSYIELDGTGKIVAETADLRLGNSAATEAAVLGTAFATLFNAHVHTGGTLGGGLTGTPTTTVVSPTHLSTKVKVA